MSYFAVNIRVLFWHLQFSYANELDLALNEHLWKYKKKQAIFRPVQVLDFDFAWLLGVHSV